jgi:hypothetical protein
MKVFNGVPKASIALVIIFLLLINNCQAQTNGIIPFTGIKYFQEGITVKNIDVKLNSMTLLNNRVPANKDIEIYLQQPTGFTSDAKKIVYAAAELSILSSKGEVLFTNPNLFLANAGNGFALKDFTTPLIKCNITSQIIKANTSAVIKIRLYDLKGKNQLRLEFAVNITRQGEALLLSKIAKPIKTSVGATAMMNDIKVGGVKVGVDTTIKTNAKMAYMALDILKIDGSSFVGILEGKEEFWVYDKNLNLIKPNEIILKEVKGTMEGTTVNSFVKIPYRLKTAAASGYVIRYRWHSNDLLQVIDVVVTL